MTLPFIFCSLVSNSRRVLDRSTRNNRLARFASSGNAFPTFKIGAKVRDVSPGQTRLKRSLKNRTVRPFFQKSALCVPIFRRRGAFRRLKSRAERRSFDVGLRSSLAQSPSKNGKRKTTKQKIRFSKLIGYTTTTLESSGFLPFSPIFLNFLPK